MAKYKLYQLYQTNKDLEVFLNTFLWLSKKNKIDDFEELDMLYEKLSDEFKDKLVTVRKTENLNILILLLHVMDANIKNISKQSQLRVKPNISNIPTIKSPFKSYNSAFTKPFNAIGVAIVSFVSNIATETHLGPTDVSNVIRREPILQEKKDRHNSLGLYRYSGKPGHIAIDHRNSALLATKQQALGTLTGNSMAIVFYKLFLVEEKEASLG